MHHIIYYSDIIIITIPE